MLIEIRLKGEEVYPSQIRGKLAFEKNVILLFRVQEGLYMWITVQRTWEDTNLP
ncbi:hypothetical protein [Metallosphaera javensis (ex Sakai et al. 2022)]|uniref:hypothetical protein n=1 Tax=Metallosphaera javensis (ex Sakai et al. 2022) TaxID=2775498 RepID=UPI0025890470|nr:MAG: hypothetical protein MjAS7_1909 [Metallosphaera javensis (ex Sakai et al. 2022)]